MDCGVPFCQSDDGCPIDNLIPGMERPRLPGRWKEALERLHKTNNFPGVHWSTCPAPCEGACVLGITDPAGHDQEYRERDYRSRFARRLGAGASAPVEAGKTGCDRRLRPGGPRGGRSAQQGRAPVTVYERADRIGGLLMYGIPNMKLDKGVVDRRVNLMREAGHRVRDRRRHRGKSMPPNLARHRCGAAAPRARRVPAIFEYQGGLAGMHFAMEFLTANTQEFARQQTADGNFIRCQRQECRRYRRR